MEQATVLHETTSGVERPGQTYTLIRTYAAGPRRIRVTVRIDSYAAQSVLRGEMWSEPQGWVEVVRVLGSDVDAASGYVPTERSGEKLASLDGLAEMLLTRSLQVATE